MAMDGTFNSLASATVSDGQPTPRLTEHATETRPGDGRKGIHANGPSQKTKKPGPAWTEMDTAM